MSSRIPLSSKIGKAFSVIGMGIAMAPLVYSSMSFSIGAPKAFADSRERDQDQRWKDFKLRHKKSYKNSQEEDYRYEIFKANLTKIDQLNQENEKVNGDRPFGVNTFTDLAPSEFAHRYLTYSPARDPRTMTPPAPMGSVKASDIPSQIDWSTQGATTPVRIRGSAVLAGPSPLQKSLKQGSL